MPSRIRFQMLHLAWRYSKILRSMHDASVTHACKLFGARLVLGAKLMHPFLTYFHTRTDGGWHYIHSGILFSSRPSLQATDVCQTAFPA